MPLTIASDRGHPVIAPESLPAGSIVKVWGTVPMPYKNALRNMHLAVTMVGGVDGLVGTSYDNAVKAILYNQSKTAFTELARATRMGWALIPMVNVTPAPPLYL